MISSTYVTIIGAFLIYYIFVLVLERKMMREPTQIIRKFLSVILLYAGISIIYFSLTGEPFLSDSQQTYDLYIFIIGFIAVLWTIPDLLLEFTFFRNFMNKEKINVNIKNFIGKETLSRSIKKKK